MKFLFRPLVGLLLLFGLMLAGWGATYNSLVTDTFGRANTAVNPSTGTSTSVIGNNWIARDGRFLHIDTQQCVAVAFAGTGYRPAQEALSVNSKAEYIIPANGLAAGSLCYFSSRYSAGADEYFCVQLDRDNNRISIWKKVSTLRSKIGSNVTIVYNAAHEFKVTVETTGTTSVVTTATVQDLTSLTSWSTNFTEASPPATLQVAGVSAFILDPACAIRSAVTYYDNASGMTPSARSIPMGGSDTQITLTGTSTSFTGSPFTLIQENGAISEIATQVVDSSTSARVTVRPGATTGGILLQDSVSGATAYISVDVLSLTVSPSTIAQNSTGNVITVSGSGTNLPVSGSPFSLSGGTGASITSQTVTTPGNASVTINAGSSRGPLTLTDTTDGISTYIGVTGALDLADSHIFWTGSWDRSVSGKAQTSNAGDYIKIRMSGASTLSITLDVSTLVSSGITTYPVVAWTVDGGPFQYNTLTSGTTSFSLFSSLNPGQNHDVQIWLESIGAGVSKWGTGSVLPLNCLIVSGFTSDGDFVAPVLKPNRIAILGDSRTQGNILYPTEGGAKFASHLRSWIPAFISQWDAEYSTIGWSGQGWTTNGQDGIPAFNSGGSQTWKRLNSKNARSWTLSDGSTYSDVLINMGTNDDLHGGTNDGVQAALADMLPQIRALAPGARIWVLVPFGQKMRIGISAAYHAYQAAYLDNGCYLLDPPARPGMNALAATMDSGDGIHPNTAEGAREAAWLASEMRRQLMNRQMPPRSGGLLEIMNNYAFAH